MSEDLIARLKAAHEAATPGPWGPDVYRVAGEVPEMYGAGKCMNCLRCGEPVAKGRFNVAGKVMPAHIHVETRADAEFIDPHTLVHFDGKRPPVLVAGNYDYEAGGIVSPKDVELIALLRNALPEIIAALEEREQVVAILRRWHSAYSSEKYTDAEADAHAEAEAWLESRDALEKKGLNV